MWSIRKVWGFWLFRARVRPVVPLSRVEGFRVGVEGRTEMPTSSQRLQYALIKEDTLHHFRDPTIISNTFRN